MVIDAKKATPSSDSTTSRLRPDFDFGICKLAVLKVPHAAAASSPKRQSSLQRAAQQQTEIGIGGIDQTSSLLSSEEAWARRSSLLERLHPAPSDVGGDMSVDEGLC